MGIENVDLVRLDSVPVLFRFCSGFVREKFSRTQESFERFHELKNLLNDFTNDFNFNFGFEIVEKI